MARYSIGAWREDIKSASKEIWELNYYDDEFDEDNDSSEGEDEEEEEGKDAEVDDDDEGFEGINAAKKEIAEELASNKKGFKYFIE